MVKETALGGVEVAIGELGRMDTLDGAFAGVQSFVLSSNRGGADAAPHKRGIIGNDV